MFRVVPALSDEPHTATRKLTPLGPLLCLLMAASSVPFATMAPAETLQWSGRSWTLGELPPGGYVEIPASNAVVSGDEISFQTPTDMFRGVKSVASFPAGDLTVEFEMWFTGSFGWQSYPFSVGTPFGMLAYYNVYQQWQVNSFPPPQADVLATYVTYPKPVIGTRYGAKLSYSMASGTMTVWLRTGTEPYQQVFSGPSTYGIPLSFFQRGETTSTVSKVFLETSDPHGAVHYRLLSGSASVSWDQVVWGAAGTIRTASTTGQNARACLEIPGTYLHKPRISPDNSRLAVAQGDVASSVQVCSYGRGGTKCAATPNLTYDLAWDAASRYVYYTKNEGDSQIWRIDFDQASPVASLFFDPPGYRTFGVSISGDGNKAVFVHDPSNNTYNNYLSVYSFGSGASTTIVPSNGLRDFFARYSPTRPEIAWLQGSGNLDLWLVKDDGTGATNLTNDTSVDRGQPAFSRDGNWIFYSAGTDLWVIGRDGTGNRRLFDLGTAWAEMDVHATSAPSEGPVVAFTSPSAGDVAGRVALNAAATSGGGATITSIRVKVDGSTVKTCGASPCTATWDAFRATLGTHTLTAEAIDSLGRTASSQVSVNLKPVLSGQIFLADPTDAGRKWPLGPPPGTIWPFTLEVKFGDEPNALRVWADVNGRFSSRSLVDGEQALLQLGTTVSLSVKATYRDHIHGNDEQDAPEGGIETRSALLPPTSTTLLAGQPASADRSFKGPIVLVHGIRSGWRKWDDWSSYLLNNGFIVFTPGYDYKTSDHGATGREVLSQLDQDLSGWIPAEAPLVIIGHSRGGVVARAMVWNRDTPPHEALSRRVKRVFTMGTPHSGTDFLTSGLVNNYGLTVDQMVVFNRDFGTFGSALWNRVYAIAGRGDYRGSSGGCNGTDDGVVFWSNPAGFRNVSPFRICVRRDVGRTPVFSLAFPGETSATDVCEAPDHHNFGFGHSQLGSEDSREAILEDTILPHLEGRPFPRVSTEGRPAIRLDGSSPLAALHAIDVREHAVAAAALVTQPVIVSSTSSLFVVVTSDACEIQVRLLGPGGEVVSEASALSASGVTFHRDGLSQHFEIAGPAAGTWTVELSGSTCSQTVSVVASESSTRWLSAGTSSLEYGPGLLAHLAARLEGDTAGASLSSVTAEVRDSAGALTATVTLHDDGAHGDGTAGDGEWGTDFSAPATPGWYNVLARASGTASGVAFQRVASAGFAVLGGTSPFTGSFTDQGADTDADTFFDRVNVTVAVNFPSAGTFVLSGDLEDPAGYPISHAVGSTTVAAAGSGTIVLSFEARDLVCSRFTGPFVVKNLRMTAGDSGTPYALWTSPVATQAYTGSTFGCTGGNLAAPTIVAVSPQGAFPGEARGVTISGTGFQDGATVSFGAGITPSGVTVTGGNALSCAVALDAGATPGVRDVTVINPDSRSVTLTDGFTVGSNQPPQVSISFPRSGDPLSGTVAFSAQASDDVGLQSVQLLVDGTPVGTDTSFPYQWTVDTTALAPGLHQATAVAIDTPGLQTTSGAVSFYTCGTYPTAVVSGGGTVCPAPGTPIQAVLTGTGPWNLTWSDGVVQTATTSPATRTVAPASDTTYTLTALSDAICAAGRFTGTAPVAVAKLPAPVVTAPSVAGAGSPNHVASVAGDPGETFSWTVTNGVLTSGQGTNAITFRAGAEGTMTVSVVKASASGCRTEHGSAAVTVLDARSALRFFTVTPCRVVDTRYPGEELGGPALAAAQTRAFSLALASCGVPAGARAISANVTVTGSTADGFLTLHAADDSTPLTSTINFRTGQTRANNAVLPVSLDGTGGLKMLNGSPGSVDVILDVNGYFE